MRLKTLWRLIRCKLGFHREIHLNYYPNVKVNTYQCSICGKYYDDFFGYW